MLDARQLEPALTEQEQLLRDAFVGEYLKDFDSYKACLRLGFQATWAVEWSKRLYEDGYVQRKIQFILAKPADTPEQLAADKAMIEATLRVVMQRGSDSARVAAAREFNAMRGWSKPDATADAEQTLIDVLKEFAAQAPV